MRALAFQESSPEHLRLDVFVLMVHNFEHFLRWFQGFHLIRCSNQIWLLLIQQLSQLSQLMLNSRFEVCFQAIERSSLDLFYSFSDDLL